MALQKNIAGQKVAVFAWNSVDNAPETGDAANITAFISKNGAAGVATSNTNPAAATNMDGLYWFSLSQEETNTGLIAIYAVSATDNILIDPVVIYPSTATLLGAGAISFTYTIREDDEDTGDPIEGVNIWVTTDEAGSNIIARGDSDSSGQVTFFLDAGNNYFWRAKASFTFDNPDLEIVS